MSLEDAERFLREIGVDEDIIRDAKQETLLHVYGEAEAEPEAVQLTLWWLD